MKLKHMVSLIASLLITTFADAGTNSGGGGGGIKMPDGRVYTLAQAGLKFYENPQDPFYIEPVVMRKAKQILNGLQKYCINNKSSCSKLITSLDAELSSNDHIYKKAEVVDPNLFNRVRGEYQKYVDKLPVKGRFIMAAYTDKKTTTLFPDFFGTEKNKENETDDNLIQTQAIYLIHEAMFSADPKMTLDKVLRVEVGIVEVLKEANILTIRQLREAFAKVTDEKNAENELIGIYLEYLKDKGITISLSQFFEGKILEATVYEFIMDSHLRNEKIIQTSPYILSENKNVDPEFFRTFFGKELIISWYFNNPSDAFLVKLDDLEFRGIQLFNKKTDKMFGIDSHGTDRNFRIGNDWGWAGTGLVFRTIQKTENRK